MCFGHPKVTAALEVKLTIRIWLHWRCNLQRVLSIRIWLSPQQFKTCVGVIGTRTHDLGLSDPVKAQWTGHILYCTTKPVKSWWSKHVLNCTTNPAKEDGQKLLDFCSWFDSGYGEPSTSGIAGLKRRSWNGVMRVNSKDSAGTCFFSELLGNVLIMALHTSYSWGAGLRAVTLTNSNFNPF